MKFKEKYDTDAAEDAAKAAIYQGLFAAQQDPDFTTQYYCMLADVLAIEDFPNKLDGFEAIIPLKEPQLPGSKEWTCAILVMRDDILKVAYSIRKFQDHLINDFYIVENGYSCFSQAVPRHFANWRKVPCVLSDPQIVAILAEEQRGLTYNLFELEEMVVLKNVTRLVMKSGKVITTTLCRRSLIDAGFRGCIIFIAVYFDFELKGKPFPIEKLWEIIPLSNHKSLQLIRDKVDKMLSKFPLRRKEFPKHMHDVDHKMKRQAEEKNEGKRINRQMKKQQQAKSV